MPSTSFALVHAVRIECASDAESEIDSNPGSGDDPASPIHGDFKWANGLPFTTFSLP